MTWRVLLVIVFISGILAYATTIDRTEYTTERLIIVPGSVTAEGWSGIEQVLIQDLNGSSLYQEFSNSNSAYLAPAALEDTEEVSDLPTTNETGSSSTEIDLEAESNNDTETTGDTSNGDSPVDGGVEVVPTEPIPDTPEPATDSAPEPATEPVSMLLPAVYSIVTTTDRYPWAQFDEEVTINEEVAPLTETITEEPTTAEEPTEPADSLDNTVTNEETVTDSSEVSDNEATDVVATSTDTTDAPVVVTEEYISPCVGVPGCTESSLLFGNFVLPDFSSGVTLDTVQLRLSLAAKVLRTSPVQQFLVSYSFDGVNYTAATVIDIEDEASNSINGDFYLAALDVPTVGNDLSLLQVKVTYAGVRADLESAYVDAVWLDVTSGQFYEPSDIATSTDAIEYSRDLEEPTINTLVDEVDDVVLGRTPVFNFEYQSQRNFFTRIFNSLFGETEFTVEGVSLSHVTYGDIPSPFTVVYHDETHWTLELPNAPQKMRPGKYEVTINILENDELYTDTFEFYWGVLAINTTRSMYEPGEAVAIHLAALTDKGDTICNADLRLKIIAPDFTITEVPVSESGACGANNVTDIPDYLAAFSDTNQTGTYVLQLEHYNQSGELVHRIEDAFEVADFVPFVIERTAPTRIYPPSPYEVSLKITANRSFEGDIVERVPRGFVFTDLDESIEVTTLEEATLLTWKNVKMNEGETRTFKYTFDAPDVSPYLYLLGPLSLDGFTETRAWQIASDAISSAAWLTATQTQIGTNLNDPTPAALVWSTSTVDAFYFNHSTSTTPERLFVTKSGDYAVSVNLPIERNDANNAWTRVGFEVRVNGVVVPHAIGRSGLISNTLSTNRHNQSSSHGNFLLTDISAGDYIEVYAQTLTSVTAARPITITGQASMYVEHIPDTASVFAGTATRTVASTTLNVATSSPLQWTETRQDTGFLHSDTINPENIVISDPGAYLVYVNMPFATFGTINPYRNVLGRVLLDGTQVSGGVFSQGTIIVTVDSDNESTSHWSGVVIATSTNQVLSITMEQEAAAGTTTVPVGFEGSIFIQKLPTDDVIALRGRDLSGGTNWNVDPAQTILWDTQLAYDATVFTHSTSSNPNEITINEGGDYLLSYNSALFSTAGTNNVIVSVRVNGVSVSGAQTKTHYISNGNAQLDSSGSLVFNLEGLSPGDVVSVEALRDANTTTVNDRTDAMLMLWKKKAFNFRPGASTMFNTPFDNVRFASTTPRFEFSTTDPDGASDLVYQFAIATSADFVAPVVRTSDIDPGFSNTASSTDTSPFLENNRIRYQLQSGDALTNGTYYWRVRAKDVTGSDEFGDWSTTQSLTVDTTVSVPSWYQTADSQFLSNVLTGVASAEGGGAVVDIVENTEAILVYGEKTDTLLKYRFWNGTTWTSEVNGPSVGGEIYWAESAAGVNRDEYVAVTLTADGDTNALVYSASTTIWGNQVELVTDVNTPGRRGIDVVYETVSGDAMVVTCSAGANPVYSIWNGSSWSATTSISVASASNCNWLTLTSDPMSDEIIMLSKGAADTYEALVWNGSSWGNSKTLGRVAGTNLNTDGMSVEYEDSGEQAIFVSTDAGDNEFMYATWDGTSWSSSVNFPIVNDFEVGKLVRDEGTDRIGFCLVDAGADVHAGIWDGSAWGTFTILEPATESIQSRPVDCAFETIPGRDGYFSVAYSDANTDEYQFFNGTSWSGPLNLTDMEEFWYLQMTRTEDGDLLVAGMENQGIDPLRTSNFNGSTWAANTLIEADPAETNVDPRSESFSLSAKRFSFAEGIILTRPINFSNVPSQATWGDVSFSTTEPVGTTVNLRLKYTNITTCDTYIPDGALAGNGVGFGSAASPINISGLSTTTYSQICLEAVIERTGPTSASLDEWEVSWVRQPKLIQSAYRWYANGSFFTPTDPWPLGVFDVAENTAITATEALNINEQVRLRIGAEGLNINLATNTASFKLQYAEGLTCSPTMAWQDVGGVGSTTAVWRGYSNAVVGSDWYNGAWNRRIKITVDNALVGSGPAITDFPVYVNLDDLPAVFFDNVQSDGDDIRITAADGLTEVPYELVSLDTVSDTGELHFRAPSLSTTTDTDFYVYYNNPSASGYSVSATYGRNNVWSNNFLAVYHLDQSPTASAPQFVDSTGNSNGTAQNMEVGDRQNGMVNRFQAIDGTNEFIDLGTTFNRSFLNSTWQIWASSTGPQGAFDGLLMTRATGETTGINVTSNTSQLGYHWRDAANTYNWVGGPTFPTSGAPFMATLTVEPTRAVMWRHAGIGVASGTNAVAHATATVTALDIGQDPLGGRLWTGGVDEMTLSNVIRSNSWIQTTYNNKANPTGFYVVSSEEIVNDNRPLSSTLLTGSDYAETYEQENPTIRNRNTIVVGNQAEWDFVLQNNLGSANTNYCFRLVYENGAVFSSYDQYPRLITNAGPLRADNSAPFDNEQTASTSPWFEFAADDELNDEVSYEVQVSTDVTFATTFLTRESNSQFSLFTNLSNPSERSVYSPGQTMRFIPDVALDNNTTYWWRVRARDNNGSGAYGEWSVPTSVTINTATPITTWLQTTEEQFATIELLDAVVNSADDVRIASGFTVGTTTSSEIRYADRDTGNAWGELLFTDNESSGDIKYFVEYLVAGDEWALVPDGVLTGNSAGFDTSGVSLLNLDTDIYHTLRVRAVLTGNSSLPRLESWSITWGLRIEPPTHEQPFDNAKVDTLTPVLRFVTIDPQSDALQYEVQIDTNSDFSTPTTVLSGVDAGFLNTVVSGDTSPFNSGEAIEYTIQSALANGVTYWWRVRARDPLPGEAAYSDWSEATSFTVDTGVEVSTWFQTTGEQFATNDLTDIQVDAGGAGVTTIVNGAMVAYGESTSLTPKYRLWNGSEWSDPLSALSVGAFIEWATIKAAPVRNEYTLATLGTDGDVNLQVYDSNLGTWGDLFEIENDIANSNLRAMDIAYESISGDLIAVACDGVEAQFAVWDGSAWSATSSIALTNANNCEYVKMASDPTSNEITAVFRHGIAGATDYEVMVWSGSSWGNAVQFGNMADAANEGISLEYEASGNQVVVVLSDGANAQFLYNTWNGSAWSGVLSYAIQDDFEHGSLARDVGTDRLALCNIDQDGQISNIFWNGAAWSTRDLLEATGNSGAGRPVDCEFETTPGRTGYLMLPYSDIADVRYQFYATSSYSGELPLGTFTDAWTTQTIRTADGLIMMLSLQDEGAAPADRYEFAYWDGVSWQGFETLSGVPSVAGIPFHESISMAAQISPNFTQGSIRSNPIRFATGGGPRWQLFDWTETTPGASNIIYRLYYETTPGTFAVVPNSALPGNESGYGTGPIDISALDTSIYHTLVLEADLFCASGECPSVESWQVEWSEGISVSGLAFEYDGVTPMASGTVAVAVNGVLQTGKTAPVSSGFTTQKAIFDVVGTSTFVVPAGVTELSVKAWGAGGAGGAGGVSTPGSAGGGAGFVSGALTVTPAESLNVLIGGGGGAGVTGSPAGGGGGGGYSALYRTTTPLMVASGGGGGGAGSGGITYVGVGTSCLANNAACTPTVPGSLAVDDMLIAVVHSRTNTAHTCTTNCTGWTEFSTQAGDGTNGRLSIWYYRATTATPPNPTFAGPATDSYTARIWAYRGVIASGNPIDIQGANTTQTAVSPYVGAGLTSTVPNSMPIFVGGTMDDNTWGPGGGVCTVPTGVVADFYAANINGNDNSVFLCYDGTPTSSAGPLSVPTMTTVANGPDVGRHFTFALRPDTAVQTAAGAGGAGGALSGLTGGSSGSAGGGAPGTQSAGGVAGGGTATAGAAFLGGNGGSGTGGGTGGAGGVHGGGTGGAGDAATARAGGGAGAGGYFGGGGGAAATTRTESGAGGAGGSSFIVGSASATTTISGSGVAAANAGDGDYSAGVGAGGAGGATSTNGVSGGNGRMVLSWTATTTVGAWSINNINAAPGDVITVFVNGATTSQRTVGVTKYDGVGDITGMELTARHLTLGSDDNATTTNVDIGLYSGTDDSDIFYTVNGANELTLCGIGVCDDARLRIKSGNTYAPGTNSNLINFQNFGTFAPGTSTVRVQNAWQESGTFIPNTSTVIFTATSGTPVFTNASSTTFFHNVTFGEGSGTATWTLTKLLDLSGSLSIQNGTLARGTSSIMVGGNVAFGTNGFLTGIGTTTFDGTGSNTWTDSKPTASSTNLGHVIIDGTTKTITLAGNVGAETVTIGADDTLNASGSGFNINVVRGWTNNNLFVPQSGTVTFVGTSTGVINRGTSPFNNLTFTGVGGNWSFATSTLALNGNLTIATGTVTLPTGTTTIAGSFLNNGGTFAHNNGEVRMTSTVGGRSVTTNGTTFTNAFYDLVFSGSGSWSFTGAATTSRDMRITAGAVTFPSTTLTVGGDLLTSGSGSFAHNNGELILLVQDADSITTNGSQLNNVRVRGASSAWYNQAWSARVPIVVQAPRVGEVVTNFPVYVNLANLPAAFFDRVQGSGADIRVTSGDGVTEVPHELVTISTSTQSGELHFRASTLATSSNSTFYIYYDNSVASAYAATSTFGRNNVWSNGYTAVYHLNESPTAAAPQFISSTGSTTGTSNNMEVGDRQTGQIGNSQVIDGTNEFIQTTYNGSLTASTWSVWMRANGPQSAYDGIVFSRGTVTSGLNINGLGTNLGYHWNDAGGTWGWNGGPTYPQNEWFMATLVINPTNAIIYRFASSGSASSTNSFTHGASTINDLKFGQDDATGRFLDGSLDEVRIANVARSQGWLQTEYNNQASTTQFYAVGGLEVRQTRIFADTNTTILGNYIADAGGEARFPTGVLSVGGSFDNNALFDANNGTVRFNSTGGSETVAAGSSTFSTLEFNSPTGDFTVTEHATATVAINLTAASQFTLQSGLSLTSSGTFTQAATGTNTTWTGSTLRFTGGDFAMHAKTFAGDTYGTLETTNDADIAMWNSSSTIFVTGSTSSVYSQDHASVDGDLFIFGNYERTTGIEHWSHATDFDGTLLGVPRQVDVRIATGSSIGFVNASLSIVGTGTASTTIAAQSGTFGLSATNTTITARNMTVADTNTAGFRLMASSTLSVFEDNFFTVVPGRSALTIDGSTVNQNPAKQLPRNGFATTTAGAGTNISFTGTTTSFIWFTTGYGNLYGEAFDANDANPGAVRFDDSSYLITVSGRVLTNNGAGVQGAPVCNGTTPSVRLVVNSGSFTASTSCNGTTGAYSFSNVAFTGDPKISVYLNTNGGVQGSVITKTPTTNITNLDIYTNQVIVRHEGLSGMSIADLTTFTNASDTDMGIIATTTPSPSLSVTPTRGLFVWASSTFTPGGPMTLTGNGSTSAFEGTLTLGTSSRFVAEGIDTHTLAGRLVLGTNALLTPASSTFVMNATTTGKSITASSTVNLHNLQFTGVGGAWNITAPLVLTGNMTVATGTVTGTSDVTLTTGQLTGDGTLSLGLGTTTIARTNTLGGTRPWTFANLVLGNGLNAGTTTRATSATTTILGRLTVAAAHTYELGAGAIDLAGTGTVLSLAGTFNTGTGRVTYSGTTANVLGILYHHLTTAAPVGIGTYTALGTGLSVNGDLQIGNSVGSSTFSLLANDPMLTVLGNTTIASLSTLSASDIATTTLAGSYDNNGTFVGNNGRVQFTGTGSSTIAAGNSSFSNVTVNGTGTFTITETATTTGQFLLQNHANFVVPSGITLAVGSDFRNTLGSSTTDFAGTVHLFGGGRHTINASTTSDTYNVLSIATTTRARMWNSSAATYLTDGGLYSQDHSGTDGLLRVYGTFTETSGTDHWSFATDFDGTPLSGGAARAVTVAFASGTRATWSSGSLSVVGTSTASTSLQNQGSGTYNLTIGGTTNTTWNTVTIRDTALSGITISGTPTVVDFSRTDHLIAQNNGTGLTVFGTALNANEAKNFTNNVFAASGGVTGASNVTATGTAVSSWRFTNHTGNLAGESFDSDPTGDPGYLVWDDSAALITISGNAYSDEGVTVSGVCDGVTNNITLVRGDGLNTYNTTCNAGTGAYSFTNVAFNSLDTFTLYINDETEKAANVTISPISTISNMHLYENRVIVRHENTAPITIADMVDWDSTKDSDVPFTAVDAGTDTLTLPAGRKLLVWTGKTFAPTGNVNLTGNGSSAAHDGTLEVQTNGRFRAAGTESHSIGGSMLLGTNAVLEPAASTITFTSTFSGRTIDVNEQPFANVAFTGSGTWTVTDANLATTRAYSQSAGTVNFGTGTTTIGSSFTATGGTFAMPGTGIVFTSTSTGNTIRFNGSTVPTIVFTGSAGAWTMSDTQATTTGSFIVNAPGTVTLPSGSLGIGGSFENASGTITHNTSDLVFTASTPATVLARGSDLFALRKVGTGALTMADVSLTLRDDLEIRSGSMAAATGTLAVGGSWTVTGGTFDHASGTVLFNATSVGKTITASTSPFHSVVFGSASGGWTWNGNATTTNNLTLTSASSWTKQTGTTLVVGGVFTNLVGGAQTTWTGSTLVLAGTQPYTVNTKTVGGDTYDTLSVLNSDIRLWNSAITTATTLASSSVYSQDNNQVDGALVLYGDFTVASSTEHWSFATDFDGATLVGGARRAVSVRMAPNATTTIESGTLSITGVANGTTTIASLGSSTYALRALAGTLAMTHASATNLSAEGINLSGSVSLSVFNNNHLTLTQTGGSLLTVTASALDANASAIYDLIGFSAGAVSGTNVNLVGSTTNAWRFTNNYGTLAGEAFDIDGVGTCGSIRFDNSTCLLTAQSDIRWRLDNGGEAAPASEWFDGAFDYRQRVRIQNATLTSYATTSLKVVVPYDSSMQSDFDDLRFTTNDGITPVPYWIERYTASTEAVVWVRVPSVQANGAATVFMYYGNGATTTTSDASGTMLFVDTFEDNNITEYSGDTSLFQTDTSPVYGGTYALEASNKSGRTTDGIFRTGTQTAQGQTIRWMQYVDVTAGSGDEACTLFGVQNANQNYAICLEQFGTDRIAIVKDVDDNDVSGTILASSTMTYATGWYEVEVDWQTSNRISAFVYNAAGSLVASSTVVDSSYTSGGLGFTFWFQNGAWDSYTTRQLGPRRPIVFFGAEQTDGGASWAAAQNARGGAIPGDVRRLRVGIENTGFDITGQEFLLEYAPKGATPSCEAVPSGDYDPVPNQASCGSSPLCMQTSSLIGDGDASTDLLADMSGAFSAGKLVESPSNKSGALDVDNGSYTEIEYVITPTVSASDSYCLRVTNNGTPLDYYENVAELGLQFDPAFGPVSLNGGMPIVLTPNATTSVFATGTVTDFNGYADLVAATSTIYRSGAGAACAPNDNNCYVSVAGGGCTFTACSGNTCTLSCKADIYFHADATDIGTFAGEEWLAYLEVEDAGSGYDFASALGVELLTLRALSVDSAINYGSLAPLDDTGTYNPTTTIANIGNVGFDIEVEGTDLQDTGTSVIPAEQQKFSTSTFAYSSCITCALVSDTAPVEVAIGLTKPTTLSVPTANLYWGIAVPLGVNSAPHQGINVFTPISP